MVVEGPSGVLVIDPGVYGSEMNRMANDLRDLGRPVVAGFSTHPHWDHLLWHAALGLAPPDIAAQMSVDLLGAITGLPADAVRIPWDGPEVRIIEHRAHAPGHAALLIEEHAFSWPGTCCRTY